MFDINKDELLSLWRLYSKSLIHSLRAHHLSFVCWSFWLHMLHDSSYDNPIEQFRIDLYLLYHQTQNYHRFYLYLVKKQEKRFELLTHELHTNYITNDSIFNCIYKQKQIYINILSLRLNLLVNTKFVCLEEEELLWKN